MTQTEEQRLSDRVTESLRIDELINNEQWDEALTGIVNHLEIPYGEKSEILWLIEAVRRGGDDAYGLPLRPSSMIQMAKKARSYFPTKLGATTRTRRDKQKKENCHDG